MEPWARTLVSAGWDPFDPGEECWAATERPPMPRRLEPADVVGIHWILVSLELERKFRGKLGEFHLFAASLFVLAELEVEGGVSQDSASRLYGMLHEWHAGRYMEAASRLRRTSQEEFDRDPLAFEPVLTFDVLFSERGFMDFEGNRAAALAGLQHVESRGIIGAGEDDSGKDNEASIPPLTDHHVEGLLDLMMAKNPGQKLFWVTDEGKFRLSPWNVRDAIELNVGAVQPVHELAQDGRREDEGNATRDEPSVFDTVADKDAYEDVHRLLQEYREGTPDPLAGVAADHYLRIRAKEESSTEVAQAHGAHPETFRKRLRAIDEFLRRRRSA